MKSLADPAWTIGGGGGGGGGGLKGEWWILRRSRPGEGAEGGMVDP